MPGGTDGGNTAVVLHNAEMLAASGLTAPIVYAGNKVAADDVEVTLRAAGVMSPPAKIPGTPVCMPQLTCTTPSATVTPSRHPTARWAAGR